MALPSLTVTARLVADPETRFTASGAAVARVRLAANARRLNKQTNEWEDGDTWFGRATAFGRTAEAITEAGLAKGELVMISGRVRTSQWEDKNTGEKKSADEVTIDEIARVLTPPRSGQGGGQRQAPAADPWASPPPGENPPF